MRIIATTHIFLGPILSLLLVFDWINLGITFKYSVIANVFLTYDTVVFGFTPTALAVALAIPNSDFLQFVSSPAGKGSTPFRDFVFALTWNGVMHAISFAIVLISLFMFKEDFVFQPASMSIGAKSFFAILFGVQFYSAFQFIVTLITLWQISDLYVNFISRRGKQ